MAQNFGERNIDLNCEFVVPKSVSIALAEISAIDDDSQKLLKLYSLLQALEEEAKKIYLNRRELPYTLSLLTDEIEKVRGECLKVKGKEKLPAVVEELLPMKDNFDKEIGTKRSNDQGDTKNWMISALWNHPGGVNGEEEDALKRDALPVPCLSLSPPSVPPSVVAYKSSSSRSHSSKTMNKQEQRKQRRCWSPELHQRFVNALDKLGGAQAATPKQIREIMNVDGLTNDEVKSHLQKYRLHVRRLTESPPSSTSTWAQPPYGVINGLVMKPAGTGAHSNSPEGPLHLGLPATTREVSVTVTGLNAVEESEEEESVRGF
ncbi:PREDICTED: myb family transcription factor EFM-like [Ipomoea nil]|uniref:myb family transcription factor EFM-like n=1 Tax=Ipomoea nil TaxID=35883 RepID=UPI0009014354|nr:PREDICTED: myb family transcription factor EFM-like [Ipomoea nil]XP_019176331.1 PREDICTED: myb family transcription factor EFM-like [Ipomoea nil]XP_019182597.1 PREDICTED: myb family transcription factor EFM-like [Ipomoea nil]